MQPHPADRAASDGTRVCLVILQNTAKAQPLDPLRPDEAVANLPTRAIAEHAPQPGGPTVTVTFAQDDYSLDYGGL